MGDRDIHDLSANSMSLGDHLEELRNRLILAIVGLVIGTIISFLFGARIIELIQYPYNNLRPDDPLRALAPADGFAAYMKVSMISGLIISSPWVFYQLWAFISAGLYPHEKKYVNMAVPFCVVLFVSGAFFFNLVVAPLSLTFFLKFNDLIGISSAWTLKDYISFITMLTLVFGIAFQMPIAIFFLILTGLVSRESLKKGRPFVILGIFVVSAIATPPDVISQITLSVPLYLLYELGIFLGYLYQKRKAA